MFEIQTFAFTLLPLLFASLTVLLVNWRIHMKMSGSAEWVAGAACRMAGIWMIAIGDPLPPFFSEILGYFLVVAGDFFTVKGLSLYAGQPPWRWFSRISLLSAFVALGYFNYVAPDPFHRAMVLAIGHVVAVMLLANIQLAIYRQEGWSGILVLTLSSFWEIFLGPALLGIMYLAGRNVDIEVALGWVQPMSAIAMIGILQTFGLILLAANRTRRELRDMALLDTLTGAPNRRAFDVAMKRSIESARRKATRLGLVLMDIDYFKRVNDTHGHAVGDALLHHVATTAMSTQRDSDFFARIGGEEFVLLVEDANAAALLEVAERIRLAIANLPLERANSDPLFCTLSAGLALSDPGAADASGLYTIADAALYRAKSNGRNRVEFGDKQAGH